MRKKSLFTITVGIAAYNEEKNIRSLLETLVRLNHKNTRLEKVIVVSDGSDDSTIREVKKVKSSKIAITEHQKRKGKAHRLQEICKKATSDVLVLVDGDIHIHDKNFLERITSPIMQGKADLTSIAVHELPAQTFIGNMLLLSMQFKRDIFSKLHHGNSIYTCHGRARALSKKLYKKVNFKKYIADDAYLFFFTDKKNMKYQYVRNTRIYYRIPEKLSDHIRQSKRFYGSQKEFFDEFGKKNVEKAYAILPSHIVKTFLISFVKNPLHMTAYCIVSIVSYLLSKNYDSSWGTAHSTK